MKNPIKRILISTMLASLISSIIILIIGLFTKWKISGQFIDVYFWAGAIFLLIGFINLWSMLFGRSVSGL